MKGRGNERRGGDRLKSNAFWIFKFGSVKSGNCGQDSRDLVVVVVGLVYKETMRCKHKEDSFVGK
jgi:hypothetical protein